MLTYPFVILLALITPFSHALANIFDGYLSTKIFPRITPLVFCLSTINLVFLPVVLLLDHPTFLSSRLIAASFAIAVIEIAYQYPYYWSFRYVDTSIVTALFSLGKIFVPLLALAFVGEHLSIVRYVGFFMIVLSGTFLALNRQRLQLNHAFYLMLFVSVLLSLQSVLFKFLFQHGASWGSAITWTSVLEFLVAGAVMLISQRPGERSLSPVRTSAFPGRLLFMVQFLTWAGEMIKTYVLLFLPVSVTTGITGTQPLFALGFALLFAREFPQLFNEALGFSHILKKATLFVMLLIGALLVTGK